MHDLRAAVGRALEAPALVAEDDFAAALHEARVAVEVVRLLSLFEERASAAVGLVESLWVELCEACCARDVRVLERVLGVVRQEMKRAGVVVERPSVGGRSSVSTATSPSVSVSASLVKAKAANAWGDVFGKDECVLSEDIREEVGRAQNSDSAADSASRCSVAVWTVALLGLAVAWVWITLVFVDARREPAVQFQTISNDQMALPALTVCPKFASGSFPSFWDMPRAGLLGSPLFTVRLYKDGASDSVSNPVVSFPDTRSYVEDQVITNGDVDECRARSDRFDPNVHREVNSEARAMPPPIMCRRCLTIGRRNPIVVQKPVGSEPYPRGGLRVEVVASRVLDFCFFPVSRFTSYHRIYKEIINEILANIDRLVDDGILNLDNADASPVALETVFFSYHSLERPSLAPDADTDISVACGVYLYSGIWFPTTVKKVSWKFNTSGDGWWKRVIGPGFGPYPNLTTMSASGRPAQSRDPASGALQRFGPPIFELFATDESESIDANMSRSQFIGPIDPDTLTSLMISKEIDRAGAIVYKSTSDMRARLDAIRTTTGEARTSFFRLQFDISYSSVLVQRAVSRSTYLWASYFANMSNVFGIFTGTSVFSLVVGVLSVTFIRRNQAPWDGS